MTRLEEVRYHSTTTDKTYRGITVITVQSDSSAHVPQKEQVILIPEKSERTCNKMTKVDKADFLSLSVRVNINRTKNLLCTTSAFKDKIDLRCLKVYICKMLAFMFVTEKRESLF